MDPDLNRLVGGDPAWRVLWRQGKGSLSFTTWLLAFLVGLLTLMGLALGLGVVVLAVTGVARAGGLGPALHDAWKSQGCGLLILALLAYLFTWALRRAWRQLALAFRDRRAEPVVLRGTVEGLDEVSTSRGSLYFLTLEGRRMSVAASVFKGLKVGQSVVAELKPHLPTLLLLLARD
ncbi:MAG TPA: hypothetical protein VJ600_04000 [Holophagaceae bacterium]|nr:hypothetical protein [Holophagaceae bacterium]